ncbi:Lam5 protein [Maudiozyma humilis]|uniref:Lam5 protein n=1 Tax=Maudiozyma humilis TaxID=51915 RepID=A0AAV5RR67_MAUHU|nr:Lam5 protein [Kazachstania humilis]
MDYASEFMADIDDWEPVDATENVQTEDHTSETVEPMQAAVESAPGLATPFSPEKEMSVATVEEVDRNGSTTPESAPGSADEAEKKDVSPEEAPPMAKQPSKELSVDTSVAASSSNPITDKSESAQTPASDTASITSPSFINNMFSTFRSYSGANGESPMSPNTAGASSPSIISHRRQSSVGSRKRISSISSNRSTGSAGSKGGRFNINMERINSQDASTEESGSESETGTDNLDEKTADQQLDYNPKKFVKEKYLDTQYHYASVERDTDFHNLFSSIPVHDRLIDDFSCALSRDFLYQGRIYITETYLGFNSNILGWTSKVIIQFKDITYMEKASSAGLFQNAISIETREEKTLFINFISRDGCFGLMKEVWSRNLLAHEEEERRKKEGIEVHKTSGAHPHSLIDTYSELIHSPPMHQSSYNSSDDSVVKSAIFSVDDDASPAPAKHEKVLNIFKVKPETPFASADDKPYVHKSTPRPFDPHAQSKELVLAEETLNCTPNQAFQFMFNEEHHDFLEAFLQSTNSLDIKLPAKYTRNEATGHMERSYSYVKSIAGIPGGTTDCLVTEEILCNDVEDSIMVINTTQTPNVPSGGAFLTKTRYMLNWGQDNRCNLMISFWVEWTGSSWIKSMVEAGCKSGQTDATEKMLAILHDMIDKYIVSEVIIVEGDGSSEKDLSDTEIERNIEANNAKQEAVRVQNALKKKHNEGTEESTSTTSLLIAVIVVLLLWNIYNQRSLNRSIRDLQKTMLAMQQAKK